ncbi:MAG: isochorismate synthase [Polyangiaceae bacterium]|nr:isochorismate synthase [Polyangiaceae bacterium]
MTQPEPESLAALLARLSARTVRLEAEPGAPAGLLEGALDGDLAFLRQGAGIVARGVAARLSLPRGLEDLDALDRARAALAAIPHEGPEDVPGAGPLWIAALPFDRAAPAALILPALVELRTAEGARFRTALLSDGAPPDAPSPASTRRPEPGSFHIQTERSADHWRALVSRAVADIARGEIEKVVLARAVTLDTDHPLSAADLLRRLAALHPSCTVFHVDGFLGASPELLVSRRGRSVASEPLAGTQPVSGDPGTDRRGAEALLGSDKLRREHHAVAEAVAAALRPVCGELDVPAVPSIATFRNVMHLCTSVRGRLHDPPPSALSLVARLHPTPAVCGAPREAAAAWLRAHEGLDRGPYAGAVGWMDARGDGDWVVGIRCAELAGTRARLIAGVGVVAGSDPDEELAETRWKLQAMLAAMLRP